MILQADKICYYLPLEEDVALHLNKLVPSLVELAHWN